MHVCRILVRSMDSVLDFIGLTLSSADGAVKAPTCATEALLNPAASHPEGLPDAPCPWWFKANHSYDYLHPPGSGYWSARFYAFTRDSSPPESWTVLQVYYTHLVRYEDYRNP